MAKRNRVKDFLESSPWALGAVAFAAIASFLLTAFDQGWKIYERMRDDAKVPTMEVAELGGFLLIVPSASMREIRAVRDALGLTKAMREMFRSSKNPAPTAAVERVAVWPVQLLFLNPASDAANIHSCRMSVRFPGVKWAESRDYFVSDTPLLDPKAAGQLIRVDGKDAKRVQLMFVFGSLEQMATVEPEPEPGKKMMTPEAFLGMRSSVADISCRDQSRRELRSSTNMWRRVLPETDSEGRSVEYRVRKAEPEK